MTAADWSLLPVLPLKCVLEHLSLEDALAATSTCRNWRHAMLVYEARRETLKLRAKDLQKSLFLTKLLKKHTRRLHVYLDCCGDQLEDFVQLVLPKFYDTSLLYEMLFIGTRYIMHKEQSTLIKLRRPIIENLVHAHRHTLQNLAMIGCEISTQKVLCKEDNEETNLRGLTFINPAQTSPLIYKNNMKTIVFSALHQLTIDYETLDQELLESLSLLPHLSRLTLNVTERKGRHYEPLQWSSFENNPTSQLEVTVNIVSVPSYKFEQIIENVLVDSLPLVAIRVMFCKTLHEPLILHLIHYYNATLRELHYVDAPYGEMTDARDVLVSSSIEFDSAGLNPFILICWRCTQLQKLVIHGYWIWQYDLIGMARLRHSTLQQLQVSAAYSDSSDKVKQCVPVLITDRLNYNRLFVQQMNQCLEFPWRPIRKWSSIHPALGPNSDANARKEYVLEHCIEPFGIT